MRSLKNILVSVLGSTPQILTETLWYLKVKKGIDIDEVYVITTSYGKKLICEGDSKRGMPALLGGLFDEFCREIGLKTEFSDENIKVIIDENGNELDDIRDDKQNELAADFIIDEIRKLANRSDTVIHCLVAGGRKTMSVYGALAMTLVGRKQDKLYHVLVSPPEVEGNPKFFYKPKEATEIELYNGRKISSDEIEITLAEIPFPRLGEKYVGIFSEKIAYMELVERIQNYIDLEKPIVSGDGGEIEMVGKNKKFEEACRRLKKLAENDKVKVILLIGESGTGKELFARYFHKVGSRSNKKYFSINCAGIPENLIESELFGYVKGAFTGATKDKKGIFEEYDGGVLFLDEINKTGPAFQEKLLRAIEYGEIRPVGSSAKKRVDVRIIIGLNQEPDEWLNSGRVLSDFYNRIMRHQVRIPPLRERKDDIPLLVQYFISKYASMYNKKVSKISEEIMKILIEYDWSMGNVRELEGVIDSMVASADDDEKILTSLPEYFEFEVKASREGVKRVIKEITKGKVNLSLEQLNKMYIEYKLRENDYNITKTADALGIPRTTLQSKMRKLKIVLPKLPK